MGGELEYSDRNDIKWPPLFPRNQVDVDFITNSRDTLKAFTFFFFNQEISKLKSDGVKKKRDYSDETYPLTSSLLHQKTKFLAEGGGQERHTENIIRVGSSVTRVQHRRGTRDTHSETPLCSLQRLSCAEFHQLSFTKPWISSEELSFRQSATHVHTRKDHGTATLFPITLLRVIRAKWRSQ